MYLQLSIQLSGILSVNTGQISPLPLLEQLSTMTSIQYCTEATTRNFVHRTGSWPPFLRFYHKQGKLQLQLGGRIQGLPTGSEAYERS